MNLTINAYSNPVTFKQGILDKSVVDLVMRSANRQVKTVFNPFEREIYLRDCREKYALGRKIIADIQTFFKDLPDNLRFARRSSERGNVFTFEYEGSSPVTIHEGTPPIGHNFMRDMTLYDDAKIADEVPNFKQLQAFFANLTGGIIVNKDQLISAILESMKFNLKTIATQNPEETVLENKLKSIEKFAKDSGLYDEHEMSLLEKNVMQKYSK